MIEYLEWDSQFFKLKIGRVTVNKLTIELLIQIQSKKVSQCYNLIYLFAKSITIDASLALKQMGIELADDKLTYGRKVDNSDKYADEVVLYNGSLTTELLDLAIESGHKSRFKTDKRLAPFFNDLYKLWIEKSLSGLMADSVLVYNDNEIRGFVTLKNKNGVGQIGLIAVDAQSQGLGIGTLLMEASMNWYSYNRLKKCIVVTQANNTGACRLYEKMGYNIISRELIYHL